MNADESGRICRQHWQRQRTTVEQPQQPLLDDLVDGGREKFDQADEARRPRPPWV